ncbi:hypothetical protein [Saccharococcus caldoxylosilyticus]|uniref:hypothetical protein n=1 Tax=Saccharococcus caldoxylosilyticus TaxID=81408 RepID=UPI0012FD2976|nr:hypothetical protein [Parageobacillus caldoxylosilyticus]
MMMWIPAAPTETPAAFAAASVLSKANRCLYSGGHPGAPNRRTNGGIRHHAMARKRSAAVDRFP